MESLSESALHLFYQVNIVFNWGRPNLTIVLYQRTHISTVRRRLMTPGLLGTWISISWRHAKRLKSMFQVNPWRLFDTRLSTEVYCACAWGP